MAIRKMFDDGVALSTAGKNEEAIAKFNEAAAAVPKCAECYANIATIYMRMKDYEKAEAVLQAGDRSQAGLRRGVQRPRDRLQRGEEVRSGRRGERAGDEADGRRRRGGWRGGASASATFNQGVILWNAGKIPEAKAQFEQAVKLDPNMAEAHYWLGMALVNAGNTRGGQAALRDLLEAGADRAIRGDGKEHRFVNQVTGVRGSSGPGFGVRTPNPFLPLDFNESIAANLAHVRERMSAAAVASRPATGRRSARSRFEDVRSRARARRLPGRPARRSARTRCRKGCRKSATRPICRSRWHLIGHLQSNKARKAGAAFAAIHSIDSVDLLWKVDAAALEAARGAGRPDSGRSGWRGDQARRTPKKPSEHCSGGSRTAAQRASSG